MNKLATVLLILVSFSSSQLLAEYRIGTVDIDRVLNETTAAKAKRAELEKLKEQKKKDLEVRKESLVGLEKNLKEKNLPDDSREAQDYRAMARNFGRLTQDAEEELKRQYIRSTKMLLEKAQNIIATYAKERELSLVLEAGKVQGNGVLYSTDSLDITAEIIKRMNS